jgi:hypothetical protein
VDADPVVAVIDVVIVAVPAVPVDQT